MKYIKILCPHHIYIISDASHIYLDLDEINNNYSQSGPPPYLRFEESKNTPFLLDGDSAEYFCNIVRFTIRTGNTLPMLIPSVVIGQDDPNKTIHAISLKYTYQCIEYVSAKNVIYEHEDATAPIPAPPSLKQDFSSKYYYVYRYTHVVQLMNTTLELAFAQLSDKMPGTSDASPLNATVAPCLGL